MQFDLLSIINEFDKKEITEDEFEKIYSYAKCHPNVEIDVEIEYVDDIDFDCIPYCGEHFSDYENPERLYRLVCKWMDSKDDNFWLDRWND